MQGTRFEGEHEEGKERGWRLKCAHQVLDVSRRSGPSTLLDAKKEG